MRLIINLVLVALAFFLVYVLYGSISEPIKFQDERKVREDAVVDRLTDIRKAQEIYRDVTGQFANNFSDLVGTVKNGKIPVIKVIGDPDDPTNTEAIRYDTSYQSAMGEYTKYIDMTKRRINLDSLEYVPYTNGVKFNIQADTLTYQSTLVNVVEVGVKRALFMGPFADERFKMYDASYDPNKIMKFGNMNAPNLAGNWER